MKKRLSIMLALVLMFACAALAEDLSGVWYLNSVEIGGTSVSPAMLGIEIVMTLNADGSAVMTQGVDEEATGTWEATDTGAIVTIGDDPQTFVCEADALVVEAGSGTGMVFGRENAGAELFAPGELLTDAAIEDFDGNWSATLIDMMGMQLPYEAMESSFTLSIADGVATVTMAENEETDTIEMKGELADGVLTLKAEGEAAGEMDAIALSLHENGVMSYSMSLDEESNFTVYFEKLEG